MIPGSAIPGIAAAALPPATVTYVGHYETDSLSTTHTVTSDDIGGAHYVLVVVYYNDGEPTACTVGGSSATGLSFNTTSGARAFWFIVAAPADKTPSIVITTSPSIQSVGVAVYGLMNLESTTEVDSDTSTSASASLSVTTISEGIVVLAAAGNSSPSFTLSSLSQHFETEFYSPADVEHTGGSQAVVGTSFSQTVTIGGTTTRSSSLVSFR